MFANACVCVCETVCANLYRGWLFYWLSIIALSRSFSTLEVNWDSCHWGISDTANRGECWYIFCMNYAGFVLFVMTLKAGLYQTQFGMVSYLDSAPFYTLVSLSLPPNTHIHMCSLVGHTSLCSCWAPKLISSCRTYLRLSSGFFFPSPWWYAMTYLHTSLASLHTLPFSLDIS